MLLTAGSVLPSLSFVQPLPNQLSLLNTTPGASPTPQARTLDRLTPRSQLQLQRSPGSLPRLSHSPRPLLVPLTPSRWPPTPPRRSRAPRRSPSTSTLSRPGASRTCPRLASSSTRRSHHRCCPSLDSGRQEICLSWGKAWGSRVATVACGLVLTLVFRYLFGQLRMLRPTRHRSTGPSSH